MGLEYLSLDDTTRNYMVEEFEKDIAENNCYTSKRFHEVGKDCYISIMPDHLLNGNDDSLAEALIDNDCFHLHETDKNGRSKAIPKNSAQLFAEGEFNRFYMRALALRTIEEGSTLEVYRARFSASPNPDSEAMVGKLVDPEILLRDLRDCKGIETTLGLPRPNSGLSLKIS